MLNKMIKSAFLHVVLPLHTELSFFFCLLVQFLDRF